jgi:hypothetical protein
MIGQKATMNFGPTLTLLTPIVNAKLFQSANGRLDLSRTANGLFL